MPRGLLKPRRGARAVGKGAHPRASKRRDRVIGDGDYAVRRGDRLQGRSHSAPEDSGEKDGPSGQFKHTSGKGGSMFQIPSFPQIFAMK